MKRGHCAYKFVKREARTPSVPPASMSMAMIDQLKVHFARLEHHQLQLKLFAKQTHWFVIEGKCEATCCKSLVKKIEVPFDLIGWLHEVVK